MTTQKKSSGTSIITIGGLVVLVLAGVYLYKQNSETALEDGGGVKEELMNRTRIFISRRNILDKISLDTSFFDDKRFYSLINFSTPVEEQPIGKEDVFSDPDYSYSKTTEDSDNN